MRVVGLDFSPDIFYLRPYALRLMPYAIFTRNPFDLPAASAEGCLTLCAMPFALSSFYSQPGARNPQLGPPPLESEPEGIIVILERRLCLRASSLIEKEA